MSVDGGRDTIVALATGAGRSALAIIRFSGPACGDIAAALGATGLTPRTACLRTFRNAAGEPLDEGVAVFWASPASATGEDVLELHVHGGPAVIDALIEAALATGLCRAAEPGEFTRRGFENDKLDLLQAEAVGDLIDSETEAQRRQALALYAGKGSERVRNWRDAGLEILAALEAEIDFPDEADVPEDVAAGVDRRIGALRSDLEAAIEEAEAGARVRDGVSIAIIGPPNAGKSSLVNRLSGREAAIVSDIPGTTRDIVEVRLILAGLPVWIADTAGLREASDVIEAEGVKRALSRAETADIRLGVIDATEPAGGPEVLDALRPGDALVLNKSDLSNGHLDPLSALKHLAVSAKTGQGVEALLAWLEGEIAARFLSAPRVALSRRRHTEALKQAIEALDRSLAARRLGAELAGEDVRAALRALASLTGEIDVEDVLGAIFTKFCIGK